MLLHFSFIFLTVLFTKYLAVPLPQSSSSIVYNGVTPEIINNMEHIAANTHLAIKQTRQALPEYIKSFNGLLNQLNNQSSLNDQATIDQINAKGNVTAAIVLSQIAKTNMTKLQIGVENATSVAKVLNDSLHNTFQKYINANLLVKNSSIGLEKSLNSTTDNLINIAMGIINTLKNITQNEVMLADIKNLKEDATSAFVLSNDITQSLIKQQTTTQPLSKP